MGLHGSTVTFPTGHLACWPKSSLTISTTFMYFPTGILVGMKVLSQFDSSMLPVRFDIRGKSSKLDIIHRFGRKPTLTEKTMYEFNRLPEPDTSPRPFDQVPGLWFRLFQMDDDFFAREALRANGIATLIGVLVYTFATVLVSFVYLNFLPNFGNIVPGAEQFQDIGALSGWYLLCQLLVVPLGFYFVNAFYYVVAVILGGKGSFNAQSYLISLFTVPVGIVSLLVGLIPCVGALVSLGLSLYALLLTMRALGAAHQFSASRALLTTLSPLLLLLIPICLIAVLAASGPGIQEVFNQIIQAIGTPTP